MVHLQLQYIVIKAPGAVMRRCRKEAVQLSRQHHR